MDFKTIVPIEVSRKRTSINSSTSSAGSDSNSFARQPSFKISAIPSFSAKKRPRTSLTQSSSSFETHNADTIELLRNIHPSEYARAAFKANGFGDFATIASDSEARFLPPTAAMLEAYNTEILEAVRLNNLARAQALYREGRFQHGCNACNRFGESILHIACRRGHLDMVQFLVGEVGLSCTAIRDDYHRTPLHDAFWTSKASYDVVDYLLKQPFVTELLLCKDKRGYTPLDYSRGEDRGRWLRFLWERRSNLKPTVATATTEEGIDEAHQEISVADYTTKPEPCQDEGESSSSPPKRQKIQVVA